MNLEELQALVAIDESGSQAAAARDLNLSRATLRRRLAQLEQRIGVPLARSGPRSVELTAEARGIARLARRVVDESTALLKYAREVTGKSSGLLRIAVPVGFPVHITSQIFGSLRELQPELRFQIICHDNPFAEIENDVDLVVHFGAAVPTGPWESFPIMVVHEYAGASPAYLATHGVPQTLDDLQHHDLLSWTGVDDDPHHWQTLSGEALHVTPVLISNEMPMLLHAARLGLGIAIVPEPLFSQPDAAGENLVKVLPELIRYDRAISVIAHESMLDLPRIQFVLDILRNITSDPMVVELLQGQLEPSTGEPF